MTTDKLNRLWLLATAVLILIIVVSCLIIWFGRENDQEITFLSSNQNQVSSSNILVDGAVLNPGSYPLKEDDTINGLIYAAGGPDQAADLSKIKLIVPQNIVSTEPQKININSAEVWLLQALPGIGEIRAKAIVEYRSQKGPFKNIIEILKVPGLNQSTFDNIKDLITISE